MEKELTEAEVLPIAGHWNHFNIHPEIGSTVIVARHDLNTNDEEFPYVSYFQYTIDDEDTLKFIIKDRDWSDMWTYIERSMNENDPYKKHNINFSLAEPGDANWKKWETQRLERGFDDTELWNLDVTIIKFTLPRLKVFRDATQGFPTEFETFENWQSAIDDMIYWMENYDYESSELTSDDPVDTDRYKRGKELFYKYMNHLWW